MFRNILIGLVVLGLAFGGVTLFSNSKQNSEELTALQEQQQELGSQLEGSRVDATAQAVALSELERQNAELQEELSVTPDTPEPIIVTKIVEVTPTPSPTEERECVTHSWYGDWVVQVPGEEVYPTIVSFLGNCEYVWAQFENAYGWVYTLEGFVNPDNPNFLNCTLTREKPKQVISTWDCTLKFKADEVQYRWQGSFVKKSGKTFAICGGDSFVRMPSICKYTP